MSCSAFLPSEADQLKIKVRKLATDLLAAKVIDRKTYCQIMGIKTEQEKNFETVKEYLEIKE